MGNKENEGYRCMKCEGKNVNVHGLYCPNKDKDVIDKEAKK